MATQIIIVLCEGPHDVAFINRILKIAGFESNEDKKLFEFPSPMNKLMANEFEKTNIEQLKSNTVCIGQTDYLSSEKIKTNKKCIEFINFINNFVNYK